MDMRMGRPGLGDPRGCCMSDTESAARLSAAPLGGAGEEGPVFEDQETRVFYESLPDVK